MLIISFPSLYILFLSLNSIKSGKVVIVLAGRYAGEGSSSKVKRRWVRR